MDEQGPGPRATDGESAGTPVYGRVTRFGPPAPEPPDGPVAPHAQPAPYGPPPPPASWSAGAGPLAEAGPIDPDQSSSWVGVSRAWASAPPPRARADHASWTRRVVGHLVDRGPGLVALVLVAAGYAPLYAGLLRGDTAAEPRWWALVAGLVLAVAATGWTAYDRWAVAGRTGQSLGKRLTRTWLVRADDGRPVGALDALLRDLLHVVDGLGLIGYLWPLWDEERRTLADTLIGTLVVRGPVPPLSDHERAPRP